MAITSAVLALLMSTNVAAATHRQTSAPRGGQEARGSQDFRGSQESRGTHEAPHYPSSGLTMEMLHGLPRTREPAPPVYIISQPVPYYGGMPAYSNTARPFGLGGYYPPGAGGRAGLGWGWGGLGWGGWGWFW